MANQSQKKNKQTSQKSQKYTTYLAIFITIWYLIFEIWTGQLLTTKGVLLFIFLSIINYFCCSQIFKSWALQLPVQAYEYYIDFIALNFIAMFFSVITRYAWYVYLAIPGYLLIIFGKWFWKWITPEYVEQNEQGQQGTQKKGKKGDNNKQKKQKIKYVKN